jgi:hypothetical protein
MGGAEMSRDGESGGIFVVFLGASGPVARELQWQH